MSIKSVGVEWGNHTPQKIQDFLDWCVERGANPFEGLQGTDRKFAYSDFSTGYYDYFGVNKDGLTYTNNEIAFYDTIVDTIEEAKDIIGNSCDETPSRNAKTVRNSKRRIRMSDLPKQLRIKASMISMGEKIAWGSDSAIMEQAADLIEQLQQRNAELERECNGLKASRVSYANLFDGDVGSIHENIRNLQHRVAEIEEQLASELKPKGELYHYPMQPITKDNNGRDRFEANPIVEYMATEVCGLNKITVWCAENDIDEKYREQLAQLIGYSVSRYGELSYVSDGSYERACRNLNKETL